MWGEVFSYTYSSVWTRVSLKVSIYEASVDWVSARSSMFLRQGIFTNWWSTDCCRCINCSERCITVDVKKRYLQLVCCFCYFDGHLVLFLQD
jgi:hypothetical protein